MIEQARKALMAGAVAVVGGFGLALADGDLTGAESLIALGVGLTACAATYAIPNATPSGEQR